MSTIRYATVFAGLFILWPVLAILGGQGYSPLLVLMAIGGLAFIRMPQWTVPGLWWLAVAWAATASLWAPGAGGTSFASGSLTGGDFSLDMTPVRLALTALAVNCVLLALRSVTAEQGPKAGRLILGAGFVHLALIALMPLIYPLVIGMLYTGADIEREGLQNALRAINALTLVLPMLLAWSWHTPPHLMRRLGGVGCLVLATLSALAMGNQAAILALVLGLGCMGVVWLMPRSGFQILFSVAAAYVLTAPFLLGRLAGALEARDILLPGSFQSRAWSWEVVASRVQEEPLFGHGLEATRNWTETYTAYPEWMAQITAAGWNQAAWSAYRVIPGHPHNMALEIWAETGLIGASLTVLALAATGFTSPKPERLPAVTRYGLAGLFGAVLVYFSFAYSIWNEAFWASVIIAATAMVIVGRTVKVR